MQVIPELVVADPAAARRTMTHVFGFVEDGPFLRLANQTILVVAGPSKGHGVIDHLALSVPNVEQAALQLTALGAFPDLVVTPDGPREIAEFWDGGVRYFFLQGPSGARIELITNLAAPKPWGHDHIGIPCSDIAASQAFFQGLGAEMISSVLLHRQEGETPVSFLRLGASVLELYQPPNHVAPQNEGLWRRLLIAGVQPMRGPDGITIAPI